MTVYLSWEQIAIRIALACIASLAIGYNRDEHGRPAGMRTVMLVTLTATLAMLQVNLLLALTGKSSTSFNVLDLMRLPGLLLSAVGLYGVMAYMVKQRTGEIGARMALGADRGRVLRMVLRGAFSQVAIGLAIGIPAAIGAGMLMTQQLFSVRPWDPVMLASATLALGLAALLASALPAWRAAGVEPMVALRNQ